MTRAPRLESLVTVPLRAAMMWRALERLVVVLAVASLAWAAWQSGVSGAWSAVFGALLLAVAGLWFMRKRVPPQRRLRAVRVLPRGTWQVRQGRTWRAIEIRQCVRTQGMLAFQADVHRLTPMPPRASRRLSFTVRRMNVSAERWRKLCVNVAVWAAHPADSAHPAGPSRDEVTA